MSTTRVRGWLSRRSVREQPRQEDAAWQALRVERRQTQEAIHRHGRHDDAAYLAQEAQWRALRQHRQAALAQRHHKDGLWWQERVQVRQALADVPVVGRGRGRAR